jgi:hypothetical protein
MRRRSLDLARGAGGRFGRCRPGGTRLELSHTLAMVGGK